MNLPYMDLASSSKWPFNSDTIWLRCSELPFLRQVWMIREASCLKMTYCSQIDYWVTCSIAVLLYRTSLTWPAIKVMIWLMRSLVSSLLMSPRRSVSQIFLVFVIISNLGSCALRSSFNAFCCWCDPVLSFVSFSTNRSVAPPDRHPIYHSCSFCWYHRRLLDLLPCVSSLPWL